MNILTFDINKKMDKIEEIFTKIYGKEHSQTIKKRLESLVFLLPVDVNELIKYSRWLNTCHTKKHLINIFKNFEFALKDESNSYATPVRRRP